MRRVLTILAALLFIAACVPKVDPEDPPKDDPEIPAPDPEPDDALTAAEKLARDDYLLFSARNYFRTKNDPDIYGAVLDLLDDYAESD